MQLSWQPGFTQSRKPTRRVNTRRSNRSTLRAGQGSQRFEFVVENPPRNENTTCSLSVTISRRPETTVESPANNQATVGQDTIVPDFVNCQKNRYSVVLPADDAHSELTFVMEQECFADVPHRTSSDRPLPDSNCNPCMIKYGTLSDQFENETLFGMSQFPDDAQGGQSQSLEEGYTEFDTPDERSTGIVTAIDSGAIPVRHQTNTLRPLFIPMPPNILYNNLSQKYKPIFDRYNGEFCKIPLTLSLCINPFRCRSDLELEPKFLVHAVMALAGHHVGSMSVQDHRYVSLQWLRQSLQTDDLAKTGNSMLDTIIILFSFDETQSTLGNWSTHLMGAYSLLEASGGINVWVESPRSAAQIGILLWWDAILSLISRDDCVFPYNYFESILSTYDDRQWDFFGLCGCPLNLVKIVMQLARLSAETRKSASMRHVKYKDSLIMEVEHSLKSWQHISPATAFQDEEYMHQDMDMMHCSEAWRNGLLLYLHRVFRWGPGDSVPMSVLYRARAVMDHVTSCRDENMVSRQALLPLFLAGCEMRSPSSREKILQFCTLWNNKTRYYMFSSAIPLLKAVWLRQEIEGFENVWWGQVVDQQHMSESSDPLQMRLCFG